VIVCGEGVVDESGQQLGAHHATHDPAGNVTWTYTADAGARADAGAAGEADVEHAGDTL